ncbi:MAG TPA: acyl-CoA dehydrogenase family protein [Acidimicrobiales bacterium]
MSESDRRESEVRADVREWIAEHWDPDLSLLDWRRSLTDSGWARPSWPVEWFGRGLPAWADQVASDELAVAGAIGVPLGSGVLLAAPTLLAHGSDHLKRQLLHPILTGEHTWCQLFSEPGAGSDLAGLTTRAERDGDEYVVNGQKLWSTSAHHADFGMLLARTDWDAPKHRGISYFALPMHQPGVEARPLRQMNGHASFNEVFFSDARVPAANMVGDPGDGWKAALTTLSHERGFGAVRRAHLDRDGGRAIREAIAEADDYFATYKWYPQRAGRVDLVTQLARSTGRASDPVVRQMIAALLSLQRAQEWTARRAQAARALGRPPGPEGSLGKLGASRVARAAAEVHAALAGSMGMLVGDESLLGGVVSEVLLSVPAQSIAGGTDEVQHNIVGERVLGLPKEPVADRDQPFRLTLHG